MASFKKWLSRPCNSNPSRHADGSSTRLVLIAYPKQDHDPIMIPQTSFTLDLPHFSQANGLAQFPAPCRGSRPPVSSLWRMDSEACNRNVLMQPPEQDSGMPGPEAEMLAGHGLFRGTSQMAQLKIWRGQNATTRVATTDEHWRLHQKPGDEGARSN
jgi:hypothetical protein